VQFVVSVVVIRQQLRRHPPPQLANFLRRFAVWIQFDIRPAVGDGMGQDVALSNSTGCDRQIKVPHTFPSLAGDRDLLISAWGRNRIQDNPRRGAEQINDVHGATQSAQIHWAGAARD